MNLRVLLTDSIDSSGEQVRRKEQAMNNLKRLLGKVIQTAGGKAEQ